MPTVPTGTVFNNHNNKVFECAEDLHIKAKLVYVGADGVAYSDEKMTMPILGVVLEDMFMKGLLVVAGSVMYQPVGLSIDTDNNVTTVTYVKADATTATTAVLATVDSAEKLSGI